MRFAAVLTTFLLVAGFAVAEDKVTFKNGKVTTGEVLSVTTNDIQILTADGEKMRVLRAVIDKVERNGILLDLVFVAFPGPRRVVEIAVEGQGSTNCPFAGWLLISFCLLILFFQQTAYSEFPSTRILFLNV